MDPESILQFGAMGLLALTLQNVFKFGSRIVTELRCIAKGQDRLYRLVTILLTDRFGDEETARIMEKEDDRNGEHSRDRDENYKR